MLLSPKKKYFFSERLIKFEMRSGGYLVSHCIAGSFLIVYGLFWCILSCWYHLTLKISTTKMGKKLQLTFIPGGMFSEMDRKSWLPSCIFPNFPFEPIWKILFGGVGVFLELFVDFAPDSGQVIFKVHHPFHSNDTLESQEKFHHAAAYSLFLLSGIVDILVIFLNLPSPTSKIFLSLAFAASGALTDIHPQHQNPFNTQLQYVVTFTSFACTALSQLRLASSTSIIINMGLGSSILLQGTWFVQLGYFLFGGFMERHGIDVTDPKVYGEMEVNGIGHQLHVFFLVCFLCHVITIAILNVCLWAALSAVVRRCFPSSSHSNADYANFVDESTSTRGEIGDYQF